MINEPFIFINIGLMTAYQGLSKRSNTILGGGSMVKKQGYGHEIYNFKEHGGHYYGFGRSTHDSFALSRFGASPDDEFVDGVLVIWVANGHVVGWYKNARLYRTSQPPSRLAKRSYKGDKCSFVAKARVKDCHLIEADIRDLSDLKPILAVPRGKGGMARMTWYGGQDHERFLMRLFEFIESGQFSHPTPKAPRTRTGLPNQPDPLKRKEAEVRAMRIVQRYHEKLGFTVHLCHKENLGWDMEATLGQDKRLLEVKGLSGKVISVELTPNEYRQMKKHKEDGYRVCVVTNVLSKEPSLHVYRYEPKLKGWMHHDTDELLNVQELKAAKLFAR
jgi:hypothetical protein